MALSTFEFQGFDIPLDLMRLTGGGPETFAAISRAHIENLQRHVGLSPDFSILEVGCGIGRDAIPLTRLLSPRGRYVGVDIVGASIRWCAESITENFPNFTFLHFDVADQLHNPGGTIHTRDIRLPIADGSVDRIILQSVFTHLLRDDIVHYLCEFKRLLKPSGLVYATLFVYDDAVLAKARATNLTPFDLRFEHEIAPGCRINDPANPLGAVGYTAEALNAMIAEAGLWLAQPLLNGAWSGYYRRSHDGQDVAILANQPPGLPVEAERDELPAPPMARRVLAALKRRLPWRRAARTPAAPRSPRVEPLGPDARAWRNDASVPEDWRRQWIERGYVTIKGLYPRALVQAHAARVAEIRRSLEEDKDAQGYGERVGQLHQRDPELMRLAVDERVRAFLAWAFGDRALLFGSLNFDRGTQQDIHIDSIFFYTEPIYAMAGLWVALEDVHLDSGPLFYIPGSHQWPFLRGENLWDASPQMRSRVQSARGAPSGDPARVALAGELGMEWTRRMREHEKTAGSTRELAVVEAGDAVFWHALLAHGGSARADPQRSRKSVVYHFIGERARLYTFDEFMLQTRDEILAMPGQRNRRETRDGLPYIAYDYYVSFKGGREILHRLG